MYQVSLISPDKDDSDNSALWLTLSMLDKISAHDILKYFS